MSAVSTRWRSAARSDTGKVRQRNEDAVLDLPERGLWVVADGMGGHQNGALASRLIVETLAEPSNGNLQERLDELRQRLHTLNRLFGQELTVTAENPDPVIGSTVVALLIEDNRAVCVWAGDSRCYLWRNSRLYQLSRDHTLQQQLIDEQQLSPRDAARHPSAQALTRAIGAAEELKLELLELDILPGDTFMLCSDGLWGSLSVDQLSAALNLPSPQLTLHRLFEQVLDGPARDNLSAVVVRQ
ncbi:PP2C family protein-serine/threonine phosphatase [Pseudomonas sp. TTU2014-080ASC]|uniref:PP2C family protein-serine/threonine phosphatase n=1 Tax=Pseudomonas sp. TTU2014-080ASC TaxID=1729724 RepID=UPI000718A9A2|nr:PP2C family serine/threonine-protein phosphatase [Pseudomonas sp. TTU2014-080ASC]KRW61201.1 protein phosphatase [Pseudomonas sp. TTU2014-080ASC]